MKLINQLEERLASLYAKAPHLPMNSRQWFADNIWWIMLIVVILWVIGIAGILGLTLLAGALLVGFGGLIGSAVAGIALVVVVVTLSLSIINIVITSIAIGPLKQKRKKGWSLLLTVLLIGVLTVLIGFLLTFELVSFLFGLLSLAIGGYFLFEIREHFGHDSRPSAVEAEVIEPTNPNATT